MCPPEIHSSPEARLENLFNTALEILAKLIEQIGTLNVQQIRNLRQQLSNVLNNLGLNDPAKLTILAIRLAKYKDNPPKPKNYPSKANFKNAFMTKYKEWKEKYPDLFSNIEARGGDDLLFYLYGLGILMTSEIAYKEIFKHDAIKIERGVVTNGRHRELAKLILAESGFQTSTMKWL